MAQADGSIRIDTQIDTKNASAQLMSLQNRIVKTADKVASLRSKMDALKDAQIPTQEYQEITNQIAKAEAEFNKLLEKQEQMQREGRDNGVTWDRLDAKMEEVGGTIRSARGELQYLVDTGEAFTLGSSTEEYAKLGQQLKYAENDMSALNQRHSELISKQKKAKNEYEKLGNTAKQSFEKTNKSIGKTSSLLGLMTSRFKGLALSLLVFNRISAAFRSMSNAIKDGFGNLYDGSESFKKYVYGLRASALTLKNSFAAAFAPIVQTAIPYLQSLCEWLTKGINLMGQFIAAITGQKTYTKAIEQTTEAITEQEKAQGKQEKAQNKQLSSLDKLNNLTSDSGGGSGADVSGAGQMFEDVPIDNRILDFLQRIQELLKPVLEYAKKLKDIFEQGFFDGLGDWEPRFESIKNSISSIRESLKDIFTDPALLTAADGWAQSVAYMLGSLAGSMSSIGLTIATNLIGGIAKYLEQNSERIKKYLVDMFDIWADINYLLAELFKSIAYVFEAFASEKGQQLTANIIGIFSDAFMGATELVSKLIRDILDVFIKPFVDNKEAFRAALAGFLGVLAEVTGTIKQGIDDTFDKLNEVYDEHFKPLFDSIANGLSEITGEFLDFWNTQAQPTLEGMAKDFDELWKSHIQPLINKVADFLGKLADLIKVLWKKWIQPLVKWIIKNVLPEILSVIKTLWDGLKKSVGNIADALGGVIDALGGVIDFLTGVFSGDWEKAWTGIKTFFGGIWTAIKNIAESGINIVKTVISTGVSAIKATWDVAWSAIKTIASKAWSGIKDVFLGVGEWFKEKFDKAYSNVKNSFSNAKTYFTTTWNNIKGAFPNVGAWFKEKFDKAYSNAKDAFKNAKTGFGNVWKNIKDAFGNIADWFEEKFSKAWEAVKKVFSSGGKVFTGIKDGILKGLKDVINALIKGINEVIKKPFDGLNTSLGKIKSVNIAGAKPFSGLPTIETPQIPALATGAVIPPNKEFLAVLGDQKHGTNIEAPLSTIEQAVTNAMRNNGGLGNNGGDITQNIRVDLDGREVFRSVQKYDKEQVYATGRPSFII